MMNSPLLKLFQRRFYTFISSWAGCCIVVIGTYAVILTAIHSFGPPPENHKSNTHPDKISMRLRGPGNERAGPPKGLFYSTRDYRDNIGHKDMENFLSYGSIDVVYTWVNGSDPVWKAKKKRYVHLFQQAQKKLQSLQSNTTLDPGSSSSSSTSTSAVNHSKSISSSNSEDLDEVDHVAAANNNAMSDNRYRDSEELRYSLRSLVKFAPWIRKIFIVTDNQIPYWLNIDAADSKLQIVPHSDIFPNKSHLPVFSSPAIESHLHLIPGLSKKFIYFNDDVFLGSPVYPEDFYLPARQSQKLYMAWDVPKCAPGCSDSWIGDGYCDKACNVSSCNFDFPDCVNGTNSNAKTGRSGEYSSTENRFFCASGCPNSWLGDKVCDNKCRNVACGWDMGDCGVSLVTEDLPGATLLSPADSRPPASPGDNDLTPAGKRVNVVAANYVASAQAIELAKVLHRNSSSSSLVTGSPMWTESDISGSAATYPVALTVEHGSFGAYFNLSYLPCEALSLQHSNVVDKDSAPNFVTSSIASPTCSAANIFDPFSVPSSGYTRVVQKGQPVGWSNFSYSSITYDIITPDILIPGSSLTTSSLNSSATSDPSVVRAEEMVTSLALLQKHQMLVILLYGHSEYFEDPATNTEAPSYVRPADRVLDRPVDIRFTVKGYDFHTQVNITARFVMRVLPKSFNNKNTNNNNVTAAAVSESDQMIPRGMAPVLRGNATLSSCLDLRLVHLREKELLGVSKKDSSLGVGKSEGVSDTGAGAVQDKIIHPVEGLLRVEAVNVLTQPFQLLDSDDRFGSGADIIPPDSTWKIYLNDTSSPVAVGSNSSASSLDKSQKALLAAGIFNQKHTREFHEGIALSLTLTPGSLLPSSTTAQLPLRDVQVKSSVTLRSGERATLVNSLCEVLATLSPTGRVLPVFSEHREKDDSTHPTLSDCALNTYNTTTLLNVLFSKDSNEIDVEPLLLLVPLALSWKNASTLQIPSSPLPMFVKVELFSRHESITPPRQTEANDTGYLAPPAAAPKRMSCVAGPFLWGDSDPAWDRSHSLVATSARNDTTNSSSILHQSNSSVLQNITNNTVVTEAPEKEESVDTYAQSLIHVNKLYHKAFGSENRKVPAHIPHLIDVSIMKEMQEMWPQEWEDTSTHRFRSVKDMQYAFAYYYYVANRNKAKPPELLLFLKEQVDTDSDGYLSENELLTLAVIIFQRNPTASDMEELWNCTHSNNTAVDDFSTNQASLGASNYTDNNSTNEYSQNNNITGTTHEHHIHRTSSENKKFKQSGEFVTLGETAFETARALTSSKSEGGRTASSKTVAVSKTPYGVFTETLHIEATRYLSLEDILRCSHIRERLMKNIPWPTTHDFDTDKHVSFEMIGDNLTEVKTQLNAVRSKKNKFVCINDQMKSPSDELKEVLRDFYLSYFPFPSEFERSDNDPNSVLYYDQYVKLKHSKELSKLSSNITSNAHADAGSGVMFGSLVGWILFLPSRLTDSYYDYLSPTFCKYFLTIKQVASRNLLQFCQWGGRVLSDFVWWLEHERDPETSPSDHSSSKGSQHYAKSAAMSELHEWAKSGGQYRHADNAQQKTSDNRNINTSENKKDDIGVKLEIWISYSVLCLSALGVVSLLSLQRCLKSRGFLRPALKRNRSNRSNASSTSGSNQSASSIQDNSQDKMFSSQNADDRFLEFVPSPSELQHRDSPLQSSRGRGGSAVVEGLDGIAKKGFISRFFSNMGVSDSGLKRQDGDENKSEDSISTLGMGGWEDKRQMMNVSKSADDDSADNIPPPPPLSNGYDKNKKGKKNKKNSESRLDKSVRWAKETVTGEKDDKDKEGGGSPSTHERKSLVSIVKKLRKNN